MSARCIVCGWEGGWEEIPAKTFRFDYGDVYTSYCPRCGLPEEGSNLFIEVEKGSKDVREG